MHDYWTKDVELHDVGTHPGDDGHLRPIDPNDVTQCGTCLRKWCHVCNPTPASRCPFEYEHEESAPARCEVCTDYRPGDLHRDDDGVWVCSLCDGEDDDLDDVVDAVREHRGDYISMVEELVEEVRRLRAVIA